MKLVDKKLLFDNLIYESSIQRGIDYFVNYDVLSLSKYYLDNNLQINAVYNKYQCQINITNYEVLNNFNCTCDIYKKYKKLCMHLIASFFAFNYQLMLEDNNLFYNSNDYSLGFYVDIFNSQEIFPVLWFCIIVLFRCHYLLHLLDNIETRERGPVGLLLIHFCDIRNVPSQRVLMVYMTLCYFC